MAIVVTEKCKDCRFTECVTVCPVACFHGDDRMLYIDPEACILCQACVPVCPVQAIYDEVDLPPEWTHLVALNAERATTLPVVEEKQMPLKASV
ncbi:4Fe-4S dicluster domain-containing protein [Bradyrhizobium canariense]|uniref:Ferredoxin n=1 Tax=Bradyrhizobium canariense TaxID=255045 RepID=A0A1H2BDL1_9BRAD|nr:ferredoxin family protein [Bradyrhizobium canariense]SDT56345.1 ferredoxin [Bradyrhizobium canariense]